MAPKTLLAQWRKELTVCGLQHCLHELAPDASHYDRQVSKGVGKALGSCPFNESEKW